MRSFPSAMKEAAEGGQSCNMPPALAQVLSAGFQRKNQPQISLGLILLFVSLQNRYFNR